MDNNSNAGGMTCSVVIPKKPDYSVTYGSKSSAKPLTSTDSSNSIGNAFRNDVTEELRKAYPINKE